MPFIRLTQRLFTLLAVSAALGGCTTLSDENIDRSVFSTPGVYPVVHAPKNLCEGAVENQTPAVIVPMEKPGYLEPTIDPAFGAKFVRITESSSGAVHKPVYNTVQAWNADESLMLVYRRRNSGSDHILLDGHTYEPRGVLRISPADLEEVFWSRHDPDRLFYVSSASTRESQFFSYNVRTRKRSLIKDLSPMCRSGSVARGGNDVHMQSMDDDLFGFRCEAPDYGWHLMSYRISTDELTVIKAGEGNEWDNWRAPMPGASGKRMWMQGDVVTPSLDAINFRLDMANAGEHANLGLTSDGQDAVFQTVFDPSPLGCGGEPDQGVGHLGIHNFETGECRAMITESQGWPYTTSSTHVSAGAYHQPGWVTLSSVGYGEQLPFHRNGKPATPLFSEIYLVNSNPSQPQVCRLLHHRSYGKYARNATYQAYFGEPHPSQSPSGTRILFGSDWQDSGSVDAYVIELPGYVRPNQ